MMGSGLWWFEWKATCRLREWPYWRRGLVGGSELLWRWALKLQMLKLGPVSHSLPVTRQSRCRTRSYFSTTMSACMAPCFLPRQWTKLLNYNPAPIKYSLIKLPWPCWLFTAIETLVKTIVNPFPQPSLLLPNRPTIKVAVLAEMGVIQQHWLPLVKAYLATAVAEC